MLDSIDWSWRNIACHDINFLGNLGPENYYQYLPRVDSILNHWLLTANQRWVAKNWIWKEKTSSKVIDVFIGWKEWNSNYKEWILEAIEECCSGISILIEKEGEFKNKDIIKQSPLFKNIIHALIQEDEKKEIIWLIVRENWLLEDSLFMSELKELSKLYKVPILDKTLNKIED